MSPQVLGNLVVLKVAMEDVTMSGKMRIAMRPLLDRPPVVGALKVCSRTSCVRVLSRVTVVIVNHNVLASWNLCDVRGLFGLCSSP